MRRLVVLAAAMAVVACGDQSTPVKPVATTAPIKTNAPTPWSPLMVCLEATGLTASPQSSPEVMVLKDNHHAVVVGIAHMVLAPEAAKQMTDRGHDHRIGNYVFEFHGGKGDRTAIRNCIKESN
jgi:hypothetical protein